MRQRILAAAIVVLSGIALWLTTRPWADGTQLGVDATWNGYGQPTSSVLSDTAELSAKPLAIWVLVACVVALLTAVAMAIPLGGPARILRWAAALFSLAAVAVPVVVIAQPSAFLGDAVEALGLEPILTNPHYADIAANLPDRTTLVALIVVLVLLSVTCVVAAVDASAHKAVPGEK